nr:helix-turn-helix transcriptional regulator [uncultured Acetobacterium sp.]
MMLRGERTQKEVSQAIGISEGQLWHIELGRTSPNDKVKPRMAKYFRVSLVALFFTFDKPFLLPNKQGRCPRRLNWQVM